MDKGKVKVTLEQATKAQRGSKGITNTLSLTSALDGVDGQRHAPAALLPGKTRHPFYRRLDWPQGRSVWVRKISLLPGFLITVLLILQYTMVVWKISQ